MQDRVYQYISEVAKLGSITDAAKELYMTPSALSKAIQKVEKEYGTPLFDRLGKRFVLTYAGKRYLTTTQKIQDIEEQLQREMSDIAALKSGLVRLGLQLSTAPQTIEAVAAFHKQYPQIAVNICEYPGRQLAQKLKNGEVDFVIADADSEIYADFNVTPLRQGEMVLLVPNSSHLIKHSRWVEDRKYPVISPDLLRDETFILPFSHQRIGMIQENLLASYHISNRDVFRATSAATIFQMVSAGLGVTLSYDTTAEAYRNLNMTILGLPDPPQNSLIIASNPERYLCDAAQKLILTCAKFFPEEKS